jgi:tRNA nucleotidyltransferase (CCA-adding enzyme)
VSFDKLTISFDGQDPRLLEAARKVAAKVPKAMLVGGFVRDCLLHIKSKDADLETYGIGADELEKLLKKLFKDKVETVGRSFGIFKVFLGNGLDLDVAIPRRESKTAPGHKGFEVEGDPELDPKEAARRRDFTINAISANPETGEVYDPFNGMSDIEKHVLRVVDPSTFVDDPLRVYRGIQFTARFDLKVEPATLELMRLMVNRGDMDELSKERVSDELKKLFLKAPRPSVGFELMRTLGLVRRSYPELHALIDTPQEPEWHPEGDVWIHTMMVIDEAAKIVKRERFDDSEALQVLVGSLCHDLGKPSTTHMGEKDGVPRIRSLGHEEAGEKPAEQLLDRWAMGDKVKIAAMECAKEHLKPGMLARQFSTGHLTEEQYVNAVRKLIKRIQPLDWRIYLAVSEADARGRAFPGIDIAPYAPGILFKQTVAEHHLDEAGLKPLLFGRDLLPFGLKPGPQLGKLLEEIEHLRDENKITTREAAFEYVRSKLKRLPNPFQT